MRYVVLVEAYSTEAAGVFATVSETASAGIRYLKAAYGTFVAGYLYDLYYVGVALVAAYGELDTFTEDSSFLVNTATHSRLVARNELFGNIHNILKERVVPSKSGDLT